MDAEKLRQIEYLKGQAVQLQQSMATMARMAEENEAAKTALDSLADMKKNAMFQLGAGLFVKGNVADDKTVLMEVGGRVIAEKTVDDAKKLLGERKKQLENAFTEAQRQYDLTADALDEIVEQERANSGRLRPTR